jgi:ligand-binding SRPBCC domain-containing protein
VGHQVRLQTKQFGLIGQELLIEFVVYDPPHQLVDVQLKGPFKSWQQTRIFQSTPEGTLLTDSVSYSLPFGLLGQVADSLLVARQVEQMFSWRQARTKQLLEHGGE